MLVAVGGSPNFWRPSFPLANKRWLPFDFQLERFAASSIERFTAFEQPESLLLKIVVEHLRGGMTAIAQVLNEVHVVCSSLTILLEKRAFLGGQRSAGDDQEGKTGFLTST